MLDVIVAGAGPAGAIAAIALARSGARVLIVDRETFPRDKLCGDTLNPGAVRLLRSLGLAGDVLGRARVLRGMRLTGPRAEVIARYPQSEVGLAITRRELDAWLLEEAVRAGARFEGGLTVKRALVETTGGVQTVRGVVLTRAGADDEVRMPALMTIGADGRRSTLARAMELVAPTRAPRRWAYGVYATGVSGITDVGEMHIRPRWYLGVAPITDSLVNLCVVKTPGGETLTPMQVVRDALAREPEIGARFAQAAIDDRVRVLGPLAADVRAPGVPGMLLAGDAAGFVDPMTGDGLFLAMTSAMLAASEAARALEHGDLAAAVDRLREALRLRLGMKRRFNRAVRALVESSVGLEAASTGAKLLPGLVRRAVRYAGDAA